MSRPIRVLCDQSMVLIGKQSRRTLKATHLVVDRFAVDRSMVYGLSGQKVYQLNQTENSGTWRQVTPEITHSVSTFEVDGDTVYIGTLGRGVCSALHLTIQRNDR